MYYLRARYYDPLNGRFNQTDPFAGSPQDPQSLHKYLYAHANPVNGIDPSGNYLISLALMIAGVLAYGIMYGVYLWNYHSSKKNNIRSKFDAWYKRQTDGWWTILPKCPCNIMVKDGKPSYNGKDRIYWHAPREPRHQEERLHPGITFSLRSIIFNSQSNQCTYDTRGKLLTEPPSAGTVDFRAPGLPWGFFMPHLYADVYPLHWAVYLDHNNIEMHVNYGPKTPKEVRPDGYMKKYYEKRPLHHNNCPRNALGSRG